jgi:hypothetical protein
MDALNALRVFDDSDKHQLLTVVAAVPDHLGIDDSIPGTRNNPPANPRVNQLIGQEARNNTIIATVVIPGAPADMPMKAEMTPDIAFGEALGFGTRTHVVMSLGAAIVVTEAIINGFEKRPELFP